MKKGKQTFKEWCIDKVPKLLELYIGKVDYLDKIWCSDTSDLTFECETCKQLVTYKAKSIYTAFKRQGTVAIKCSTCKERRYKNNKKNRKKYLKAWYNEDAEYVEDEDGKIYVYEKNSEGKFERIINKKTGQYKYILPQNTTIGAECNIKFRCKHHGGTAIRRIDYVCQSNNYIEFNCCKDERREAKKDDNTLMMWIMLFWRYVFESPYILNDWIYDTSITAYFTGKQFYDFYKNATNNEVKLTSCFLSSQAVFLKCSNKNQWNRPLFRITKSNRWCQKELIMSCGKCRNEEKCLANIDNSSSLEKFIKKNNYSKVDIEDIIKCTEKIEQWQILMEEYEGDTKQEKNITNSCFNDITETMKIRNTKILDIYRS